jgi:predicted outer membrane repeat protein
MNIRQRAFVPVLVLLASSALAQTQVSGNVSGTWLETFSPFIVDGTVTVPSGQELVIEPGVEVLFAGSHAFNVEGRLMAVGAPGDTIRFQPQDPAGTWGGINFTDLNSNGQQGSTLSYCRIEKSGSSGVDIDHSDAVVVEHCLIVGSSAYRGGGVNLSYSDAVLRESVVAFNSASLYGGGIYAYYASPQITDVIIESNETPDDGGGAYFNAASPVLDGVTIRANDAYQGGGVFCGSNANYVLSNSIVEANTAYRGAGIYGGGGTSTIQTTTIASNVAGNYGGGIYAYGHDVSATDVTIENNTAAVAGGVYAGAGADVVFTRVGIIGNASSQDGGGLYIYTNSSSNGSSLTQVTFSANVAGSSGGAIYRSGTSAALDLNSAILWGNQASSSNEIHVNAGTVDVIYSDIWGTLWPGTGNISAEPMFANPVAGDYTLMAGSPCIDTGDPALPADPDDTRADMGAYFGVSDPTGTITISVDPVPLRAPWVLTGPEGQVSAAGDTTLAEMPVGEYILSWGNVAGWTAPTPSSDGGVLEALQTLAFGTSYGVDDPQILAVDDVPDDQGGWVRLDFERCGLDIGNADWPETPITGYNVHRRVDGAGLAERVAAAAAELAGASAPGQPVLRYPADRVATATIDGTDYVMAREGAADIPPGVWEVVGTVYAMQQDTYLALAPTLADQVIGEPTPDTVYFVSAHTTIPSLFYCSAPASGISTDDIAPSVPDGFQATYSYTPEGGVDVALTWTVSEANDLDHYRIYSGETPDFEPDTFSATTATAMTLSYPDNLPVFFKVSARDHVGNESEIAAPITVVGVDDSVPLADVGLHANYPNPFNPVTRIPFAIARAGAVRLAIYDLAGRMVTELVAGDLAAGPHTAVWTGTDARGKAVASGSYLCVLEMSDRTESRVMTLVR